MRIVVVTGMSGAGKSSALHLLEDMGYYCMDNLPPRLLVNFLDLAKSSGMNLQRVALGVDIRGGEFFDSLEATLEALKKEEDLEVITVFLTASDETIVRRYKEKRRPHPMDKAGNIYDGIQREKFYLEQLRQNADFVVDTTNRTLGQLKEVIDRIFLPSGEMPQLLINVVSFGYKHGILLDADLVFDVRFINNPYYIPELKYATGLDASLQEYVFGFPETGEFLQRCEEMLDFLIPNYIHEGKSTLTIGIGCTGGRHRSVALAERLGEDLQKKYPSVSITHRDRRFWD